MAPRCTRATMAEHITIGPLEDLTVERVGWHLEHEYVETFWLPVVGPTALVFLRKWGRVLRQVPAWTIEKETLAKSLGIGMPALFKMLDRMPGFHLAQWEADDYSYMSIRRALPNIPEAKLLRLPDTLQVAHEFILKSQRSDAEVTTD